MWEYFPMKGGKGGGHGAVELLALSRDPLECDSSRRWGVVHRLYGPHPHHPPRFTGEGSIPGQ